MPGTEISQYPHITSPPASMLMLGTDTTDTSQGPTGTTKVTTIANLVAAAGGGGGGGGTLTGYIAPEVVILTFGSSVAVNAALGNAFNLTVTANCTIANPTNLVNGQVLRFRVTSGGSFATSWGTAYDFGTGSAPVLSTTAGKVDIVAYEYVASISKLCYLGAGLGY